MPTAMASTSAVARSSALRHEGGLADGQGVYRARTGGGRAARLWRDIECAATTEEMEAALLVLAKVLDDAYAQQGAHACAECAVGACASAHA
eukprot:6213536-Pleurochrysis_carterae.AAC.4